MKKKTDEIKQRVADKLGRRRAAKLRKALNIAKIVKNIVCWTLVAVLVFIVITFLLARVNGGTPSVFGYTLHRIETGSMEPELHVEDVILCKDISDVKEVQAGMECGMSLVSYNDIKEGDIIETFTQIEVKQTL